MIPSALHSDFKLLLRALSSDSFPVIFLEHQNYRHIPELAQLLDKQLPDISFQRIKLIDLPSPSPDEIIALLGQPSQDILWIEDTEAFLQNPQLRTYLNQKRDLLATRHRGLLFSLRSDFMPKLAELVPDLYSVRALSLDWRAYPELPAQDEKSLYRTYGLILPYSPGKAEQAKNLIQYQNLINQLENLPEEEMGLRISLSRQALGLLSDRGDYPEGIALAQRLTKRLSLDTHPYGYEFFSNLVSFNLQIGEPHQAQSIVEQIYKENDASKLSEYPVSFWLSLAAMHFENQEYQKSLILLEGLLMTQEKKTFPALSPLNQALVINFLGAVYLRIDDWQKALSLAQKALNLLQDSNYKIAIASIFNNVGNIWTYLGDYERAILEYVKAQNLLSHSHFPDHPFLIDHYLNQGFAWGQMGEIDSCRQFYTNAIQISENRFGQFSAKYFQTHNLVLRRHMIQKYPHEEDQLKDVSLVNSVIILATAHLPPDHPQTLEAISIFKWYQEQLGRSSEEIREGLADLVAVSEQAKVI